MNSLYNMLNAPNPISSTNSNVGSDPMSVLAAFNAFRQNFKGDPKQAVMNLINNGSMSQQTFTELAEQAKTILPLIR